MRYSPLRVEGKFTGVLGITTDITERREAEQALEESERRLSTLLSNAPAYLYRCRNEPEWPNEYVSDYAFELTGYTPKALTDGSVMFAAVIVEEDRDRVWDEVQEGPAERRRFEVHYSILRKDGELRHVEERGQGVYGENNGELEALEGVIYDVTKRVRAEKALREAEERFRRSFEDAAIGMALVATDGRWLQVNDALCQLVGYPKEELLQKTFQEITHPYDLDADLELVSRALSGEIQSYQLEKRYFHKEGHIAWILLSVSLVNDEEGEPLYFVSQIQDITGRKEAEAALREACLQTIEWRRRFAADPPLSVYVNLSAKQFREPDLTELVSRILKETGLDPTCLHLEITESTAMSDAPATVSTLEELTALGVRLVIDDFGTGYSSLSYLERFPVDYVKIDHSFVGGLEREPGALVAGMISLAHALGIRVIAEGVERAEQLERVHAMGCDLAQGRYFSDPLLAEAMGALLMGKALS